MAPVTPIRLIGNPEENFYGLGKKHHELHRKILKALKIKSPGILQKLTELTGSSRPTTLPDGATAKWLISYCEGLEVSVQSYLQFMAHIEAGPWTQGLTGLHSGDTSAFVWNAETQTPEHLRFLDWNLKPENPLELLLIKPTHGPQILVATLPGLPFHPFTAMNDSGLSVALHRRYNLAFHAQGLPIGTGILDGLLQSKDSTEFRKSLKNFSTQRMWGLHVMDSLGSVVAMDVMGPQVDFRLHILQEEKVLVFTNAPLLKDTQSEKYAPASFIDHCHGRKSWLERRLMGKGDCLLKATHLNIADATPYETVTTSTIQALSFSPAKGSIQWICGESPLWHQGQVATWSHIFSDLRSQPVLASEPSPHKHWACLRHYSLAQEAQDQGEETKAFHHLQMGVASASNKGRLGQGQWIFNWWQWKHLTGKRQQLFLYKSLSDEAHLVPESHQGHVLFLKKLIELELGLASTIDAQILPRPFNEWAKMAELQGVGELHNILEARLDLQDLILRRPQWTDGPGTR